MVIYLVAIGQKMPSWVQQGFEEYVKRMPKSCEIKLLELPLAARAKNYNVDKVKQDEMKQILATLPKGVGVVALDERGKQATSLELAGKLEEWLGSGRDMALLIGGPDGLARELVAQSEWSWSLGKLTLPHPFVRIILAEQLYRAWSIIQNHPYHRE